jgi:hypothetical protein
VARPPAELGRALTFVRRHHEASGTVEVGDKLLPPNLRKSSTRAHE